MQCLAQAAGERVGQAEDAGGNAFGAPRCGSQPATAVRAVYPHIRQVGTGIGQRVVFIVCQLGIHLAHGGIIGHRPDGRQMVGAVATHGGVSAYRRRGGQFGRQLRVQPGELLPVVFRLAVAPVAAGIVRHETRAVAVLPFPCGADVAGGRQGGFQTACVGGGGGKVGLAAYQLPRQGGKRRLLRRGCSGAVHDVVGRQGMLRRIQPPMRGAVLCRQQRLPFIQADIRVGE